LYSELVEDYKDDEVKRKIAEGGLNYATLHKVLMCVLKLTGNFKWLQI